ncbi:hypothetical protein FGU71_12245 [Erythrobacter insulae]|uniref:Uncharacterized protein n=1 Tax=Erythrobacter insulae TaxID=2584124 RepID=A0A547PEK1_9SPHN|nr:hypothetical protein [Erythrobacter insulae]TRD12557.1 hypothetical protein FGU71_12245 [Erythrobacter insulae]
MLLRIALQSRSGTVPVVLDGGGGENWVLARDENDLAKLEKLLLDRAAAKANWAAPFTALSAIATRSFAHLSWGREPVPSAIIAVITMALAIIVIWQNYAAAGLAIAAIGAFMASFSAASGRLKSALYGEGELEFFPQKINIMVDVLAIVSLVFVLGLSNFSDAAIPVIVIGLLQLAARDASARAAPFWNDRALHLAAFAICTVYGGLSGALIILGLAALAQCLWLPNLTKDNAGIKGAL